MPKHEISFSNNSDRNQILQRCKSSDIEIIVVSEKDNNQELNYTAKIYQESVLICQINNRKDITQKTDHLCPGNYIVSVHPELAAKPAKYQIPYDVNDFTFNLNLKENTTTTLKLFISRKESIMHNIEFDFIVSDGNNLDDSKPIHAIDYFSEVSKHSDHIKEASIKYNVKEKLIKSIIFLETTHGYYDGLLDIFDMNKSLRPMNINVKYWGEIFNRDDMKNSEKNVLAGAYLLKIIEQRIGYANTEKVATIYNNLNATVVSDYGARVKLIFDKGLYNPPQSILKKIDKNISSFEDLSTNEQLKILKKMFGG